MTEPTGLTASLRGGGSGHRAWAGRLNAVLREPDSLQLFFQPIVDLQRGIIVGYESLARFWTETGHPSPFPPDQWFAAADRHGIGARLEAMVVRQALTVRAALPSNCFLTVNVSPHLLTFPELAEPLLQAGDLSGVVLELTEHQLVPDLDPLLALLATLRGRGAMVALDDAGSGYSGLQQLAQFRPHIIKLDRALVADIDTDEVKLALAATLGEFGGRIDSWLLAEGIETWPELEAFLRLGTPLAQGYLLGRPAPGWTTLDPEIADGLRVRAARMELIEHVASLVEAVPDESDLAQHPSATGIRVDRYGHPLALLLPWRRTGDRAGHQLVPISLRVPASADPVDVARRAVARDQTCRFDPVVCVDDIGAAVGIIRIERLVTHLADYASRVGTSGGHLLSVTDSRPSTRTGTSA